MESFSTWYYREAVNKAMKIWQSLVLITFDTFSIPLLAKTLFAPWRRDIVHPTSAGLQLLFQAVAFNLVSRIIGLTIRALTILAGAIITLLVIVLGAIGVAAIAAVPVIFFFGVLVALILFSNPVLMWLGGTLMVLSGIGMLGAYSYWRQVARFNPPLPEPLDQVMSKFHAGKQVDIEPYVEGHLAVFIKQSHALSELFSQLIEYQEVRFILARALLPPQSLRGLQFPQTLRLKDVIIEAAGIAQKVTSERITAGCVFLSMLTLAPTGKTILNHFQLNIDELVEIAGWYHHLYDLTHQPSSLVNPSGLKTTGGIGRDWAAGYTPTLERFAHELTAQLPRTFGDHYVAHKTSIDQIERVLARSGKHNVLLVGEPGIGKRTVMLGLTWRIHFGQTLRPLRHKRVLELDVSAVLAGAGGMGDLEARLVTILSDAVSAGNVIMFIDRAERLFGAEVGQAGAVNAGEILIPYLESSALQLVGTTSYADFHRYFERLPGVVSQFERIEVKEPNPEGVGKILEEVVPIFEARHGILVSFPALKELITVADRYLPNRKFPEKAIDLLDEAAVHLASSSRDRVLLPRHIDEVVTQKTNVPIGQVETGEKEKLLNLEDQLHGRVVNQQEAILAIAQALRRSRSGVARTDRPIGTFLFLGPTGVGKTETAKSLAAIYFGSEKTLIRFDMNEFQEISSINRLIGGAGFEGGGLLTNAVKERPFSVVLLDEVEKAHPNVLNLFLQLLDEGRLQDGNGEVIDFTNAIIIGTSNAGAEMIRERIKGIGSVISSVSEKSPQENPKSEIQMSNQIQNPNIQNNSSFGNSTLSGHSSLEISHSRGNQELNMAHFKDELIEYLQHNNIFRPEFLNRFDAVVAFRPLTKEELTKVVELHVKRINKNLADKEMSIIITPQATAKLAEIGFDPQFGARALARAVQQRVENLIADKILHNELAPGGVLEITEEMVE